MVVISGYWQWLAVMIGYPKWVVLEQQQRISSSNNNNLLQSSSLSSLVASSPQSLSFCEQNFDVSLILIFISAWQWSVVMGGDQLSKMSFFGNCKEYQATIATCPSHHCHNRWRRCTIVVLKPAKFWWQHPFKFISEWRLSAVIGSDWLPKMSCFKPQLISSNDNNLPLLLSLLLAPSPQLLSFCKHFDVSLIGISYIL